MCACVQLICSSCNSTLAPTFTGGPNSPTGMQYKNGGFQVCTLNLLCLHWLPHQLAAMAGALWTVLIMQAQLQSSFCACCKPQPASRDALLTVPAGAQPGH